MPGSVTMKATLEQRWESLEEKATYIKSTALSSNHLSESGVKRSSISAWGWVVGSALQKTDSLMRHEPVLQAGGCAWFRK